MKKNKEKNIFIILAFALLAIIFICPFLIMIIGSFKPGLSLNIIPVDLSPFRNLTIKNYIDLFSRVNIPKAFVNSLYIVIFVCCAEVILGITTGYLFATEEFHLKKFLFGIVIVTMMIPRQLLLIPNFMVAKSLNLIDSLTGVALTTINASYGIFLTRQKVINIPKEFYDAAKIDGCNEFQIFINIIIPQLKPTIIAIAIYSIFGVWNDYLWQNIMLTSSNKQTIPLLLAYLANSTTSGIPAIGIQLAGSVISLIPVFTFFISCKNMFIENMNEGSIKE